MISRPGETGGSARGPATRSSSHAAPPPGTLASRGTAPGEPISQEAQLTAGVRITPGRAYGFFTDTTLCIGCKACEVACKQWNNLPADNLELSGASYDNTRQLSATTWRHVAFIEQFDRDRFDGLDAPALREHLPAEFEPWGHLAHGEQWAQPGQRWIFMSDVCKHCRHAPCLEACPTGSIIRTEFDSVYVQQDVCNGCGYCVSACPFGVVDIDREGDGKAHKCTLCYDRLRDGMEPACAKACPTDSIQFGPVDEMLTRARKRVGELRARGIPAYLYGTDGVLEDECDTTALEGLNCFFLLIDRPEVYNLPPVAHRPSCETGPALLTGMVAAAGIVAAAMLAVASGRSDG